MYITVITIDRYQALVAEDELTSCIVVDDKRAAEPNCWLNGFRIFSTFTALNRLNPGVISVKSVTNARSMNVRVSEVLRRNVCDDIDQD